MKIYSSWQASCLTRKSRRNLKKTNMNIIKKSLLALAAGACLSFNAMAAPIFLGTIVNGIPSNLANEQAWTQYLINMAPGASVTSATAVPSLPGDEVLTRSANVNPGLGDVLIDQDKEETSNTSVGAGFDYVTGKYGSSGTAVWFLGGDAFVLPTKWANVPGITGNPKGGGLSHVTTYGAETTTVPDGGASVALLGLGSLALAAFRRKA